ncbi:MAG: hypothetical protein A3F11_12045 [Gammaproteobacteria bacterium RIFCSPHIGHO2_12_FULL_37_14]|nr:MAG: hypothetical protein A3F11_12045 [Gammaproteobacteria bacterium RIFCSPHIGHO2_12_FULL_37_14]
MFSKKSNKVSEYSMRILESKHIRDVLKHCTYNSMVIFDLDNTIVESAQELGGDQWFVNFIEYAAGIIVDRAEAISVVLGVYHAVQYHVDLRAVQSEAMRIIQILQDVGIPVLALTARSTNISEPTLRQLDKLGIQFSKQWDDEVFVVLRESQHVSIFEQGVVFCDGLDKGRCLDAFLKYKQLSPQHVVMMDDKEKYLWSVDSIMRTFDAQFIGLRYGYLDEKVKAFNLEKSMQELTEIAHELPKEIQSHLNRLNISMFSTKRVQEPIIHLSPTSIDIGHPGMG